MSERTIQKPSKLLVGDLLIFAKRQARFDYTNYQGAPDAFRSDYNARRKARRAAARAASFRWNTPSWPIFQGKYFNGRLIVHETKIEYFPGQYAATEIYWAIEDYFNKTRDIYLGNSENECKLASIPF